MLFLVNPFWITSAKYMTAGVGTFVVGGKAATFSRALGLPAAAGAIVLSGKAAGLLYKRRVDAQAAAFALSGMQAQFINAGKINAEAGSFALGGQAATLRSARIFSADLGSFALAGKDAALLFGKTLVGNPGIFTITGNEAAFIRSLMISAGAGQFQVTGQDSGLLRALMLSASNGAYILSGQAANLLRRFTLGGGLGAFALGGQAAGLNRGRRLVADAGAFSLTGQDATLTYTIPRSIAFTGGNFSSADLTNYTLAINCGTADQGDLLFILVASGGNTRTFGNVTVDGTVADNAAVYHNINASRAGIWVLNVGSGKTGTLDVVVNQSGAGSRCGAAVYRAKGYSLTPADNTSTTTTSGALSVQNDVPANGIMLGVAFDSDGGGTDPTFSAGMDTTDYTVDMDTDDYITTGMFNNAGGGALTNRTVSMPNRGSRSNSCLVVASFAPV